MLLTVPLMTVALVGVSIAFYRESAVMAIAGGASPTSLTLPPGLTRATGGVLVPGTDYPANLTTSVLIGMAFFVAAYATGLGNIPWQQGELFALEVRGLGTSLCTATNWLCNLVIAATFLSLMQAATPAGAFGLYAAVCAAGWVFCYYLYPETSGLSLEEVSEVFKDGFGVHKSGVMRAAKRARRAEQ
jgi:SP family myo-inositol transporter-like MFS transporter 13